jgi:hypothetical protein
VTAAVPSSARPSGHGVVCAHAERDFYQFWLNTDDRVTSTCVFQWLDRSAIDA